MLLGTVPRIVRAGSEGTRYAITDRQAFLLRGLRKLKILRFSIPPDEEILVREESKGLDRVRFLCFRGEFRKVDRDYGLERLGRRDRLTGGQRAAWGGSAGALAG